jgi:hypothetical protein
MILTKLFVILLTILLILEMIKYFKNKYNKVIEGAATMAGTGAPDNTVYTDPGTNKDPGYLSSVNESNIKYLKNQVDGLVGLKQQLADLSTKVDQNTTNIGKLSSQMSGTGNAAVGRDPNSTDPPPQTASGLN